MNPLDPTRFHLEHGIDTKFNYVDFEGPCAHCNTSCQDEWRRMWDRKFNTGFLVEGLETDPAGGLPQKLLFGKKWPQYSVKANTFPTDGESVGSATGLTTFKLSAEVKVGDIRVAYTDHWISYDGDDPAGTRTFMKRPEEYWAAKAHPMSAGSNATQVEKDREDWIRCRHSHTDHLHLTKLSNSPSHPPTIYPIAVDDCVTGIWDYNIVDTCTTIETHGIYEAVHLYEIFPICGNLNKKSPPDDVTSPLFHIFADQTGQAVHRHGPGQCDSAGHAASLDLGNWLNFMKHDEKHPQPCGCNGFRLHTGKGIVSVTSPWCDHTLSQRSKNPHRLGIETESNGYRAQLFDNEGEDKAFGAVSETFLFRVGTFYKTIVRHMDSSIPEKFQAPSIAKTVMYTFRHPEESGHGPAGPNQEGGGFWCTRTTDNDEDPDKWATKTGGAVMLLQLPCKDPVSCSSVDYEDGRLDGDGEGCCENWDHEYCEEQLEHIYFTPTELLEAFDRDMRNKSADLEENATRDRIHEDEGTKALSCQTTNVNGWVWLELGCDAEGTDKWERGLPNDPPANCKPTGSDCSCGVFPGPPPSTLLIANWHKPTVQAAFSTLPKQSDLMVSTLWGVDGINLGSACSWSQHSSGSFSHCNAKGEAFLIGLGFFTGIFLSEHGNEGKIQFNEVKHLPLHLPSMIPDGPWAEGGSGASTPVSIMRWTSYDMEKDDLKPGEDFREGSRYTTDWEAAEVFHKVGDSRYWYDLVAKKGQQLNFMGELVGTKGNPEYLATNEMENEIRDPKTCDKFGNSICGRADLVAVGGVAGEFGPWCSMNPPVVGCDNTEIKVFTGAGDPAPRFDENQRVKTIEVLVQGSDDETTTECVQYVDEIFGLSQKLTSHIVDAGNDLRTGFPCALNYAWKPYIRLKDQHTGFWTCGIPVGVVDRSVIGTKGDQEFCYCQGSCGEVISIYPIFPWELDDGPRDPDYPDKKLCEMAKDPPDENNVTGYGGTWVCKDFSPPFVELCSVTWNDIEPTLCGLAPESNGFNGGESQNYTVVSCTSCADNKCRSGLTAYNLPLADAPHNYISCYEDVHCCTFLVANPYYDPNITYQNLTTDFPHPKIDTSSCFPTEPWCQTHGYAGGLPHVPYDTGYIWHTVLGWHPDSAISRGRFSFRYSCDTGRSAYEGNEEFQIWECLPTSAESETVPCYLLDIPKSYRKPEVVVVPAPVPVAYLL